MLSITNKQPGARGVNAVSGPVLIEPGQTVEVEVYARERQHIEATGWFDIEGDYTPEQGSAPAASDPAADGKAVLAAIGEQVSDLRSQLADAHAEISDLKEKLDEAETGTKKALADRDHRIAELEAKLAAKADAAKPEGGAKGSK